jgi:RimJ/RimL family protein N-acetyltransferase
MLDVSKFSAIHMLRDGRQVLIRAIKPEDRDGFVEAVSRASPDSLRRRFFTIRRHFSEQELERFSHVDFSSRVALTVVAEENGQPAIVGGGRYVMLDAERAEVAFALIDQYQGQGIGTALMRHLESFARQAGLKELIAEVLPENAAMLNVFRNSGLRPAVRQEQGVVHVTLRL